MIDKTPALGGLSSPIDYRDNYARAIVPSVSLPASMHTNLGSVLMQDQTPSCVSHSVVKLIALWWFREHGEWVDFSPRFLDILSAEPQIPLDGGRVPRTVLRIAANYGCATTATLSNNTLLPIAQYRDKSAITAAAYAEAQKYKIPGYINVALDMISTRTGIYLYGALTTLFQIGEELWTPSYADKDIDPLRTPKAIVGGHELTLNGWDADLNNLRNSWSGAWANNGEAHYDPLKWRPYTIEQWAIAEVPTDVKAFLSSLPSQVNFHYQWNKDMTLGNNTEDVKFAQIALMILGFLAPIPAEDLGIYGPKTSNAVSAYQKSKGISPVAPTNIGPRTRAALNKDFAI